MEHLETTRSQRWHDLDALRAVAMLLGIALHAALSFIPDTSWVVNDIHQHDAFGFFLLAVHGFRMPVFFLMSGFFTAMLWQRKGLKSLLKQRFQRVALPLMLGMLTITPLMILASIVALIFNTRDDMWIAAEHGDIVALTEFYEAGADVNALKYGVAPLYKAAEAGQTQTVRWLIQHGADVNTTVMDGTTPLDAALAESHDETARLLQRNGGKVGEKKSVPVLLMKRDIFMHLWFLWHLCWLVVAFALIVTALDYVHMPAIPENLVLSFRRYFWLIPLTMLPQVFMAFPSFGPDTASGLIPMPHVLLFYAIFFGFGALYYHYRENAGADTRRWWLTLPFGLLVIFPLGIIFTYGAEEMGAEHWTLPAVFLQALYPWVMTFGLMGLFRRFFSQESKTMRYISDSSYWLYLAHLPLIIALQGVMQNWALPAVLKFLLICSVVTVGLLFVYEHGVRYHWLGRFLNGPRQRPMKHEMVTLGAD